MAISTIGFGFSGGGNNGGGGGGNSFSTQQFSAGSGLTVGGNTVVLSNTPKLIEMVFLDGTTTTTSQWNLVGSTITFTGGYVFNAGSIVQVQYQY